jgi:hypothetical protein
LIAAAAHTPARYHSKRDSRKQYCVMVDVSTKYKRGSNDFDS